MMKCKYTVYSIHVQPYIQQTLHVWPRPQKKHTWSTNICKIFPKHVDVKFITPRTHPSIQPSLCPSPSRGFLRCCCVAGFGTFITFPTGEISINTCNCLLKTSVDEFPNLPRMVLAASLAAQRANLWTSGSSC